MQTTTESATMKKVEKVKCTGCPKRFPQEKFGRRKDGRWNTRCGKCRQSQAKSAGMIGHIKAVTEMARDMKALRVVERYVGVPWKDWTTKHGREAEIAFFRKKGLTFEELWTERMIRLGQRWNAMKQARKRIAARAAEATAAEQLFNEYAA